MKRIANILFVPLCLGIFFAASAGPARAQLEGEAAFVFGYYPKEGGRAQFDEGYRRHIEWHREHGDQLPWYGWYVTSGERIGMFIDGTFGISFNAYDLRVDLAEDSADAAKNVSPFARPVFRRTWALREDLSTGTPLEDWQPTSHVQVFHYELRPGMTEAFENVVRESQAALEQSDDVPAHTWYELVVGGKHPTYLLMVHRDEWSSYGNFRETLASGLAQSLESDDLQSALARSVERIRSEVWAYRSDLSYFPGK